MYCFLLQIKLQIKAAVLLAAFTLAVISPVLPAFAGAPPAPDPQPSLSKSISGYADGYDLKGDKRKEGSSVASGDLAVYKFGQNYLRVFADYVYLPAERGATNSVSISVTTLNKTPLTFKSLIESQPKEVYSQRGQYFVTPFFALNTKSPLEIRLEQRQTHKAGTNTISFVQSLLSAAANVFTGGAASTISSLTNYARASNTLVSTYEANTTIADVNRKVAFDDVGEDQMTLATARIAFFTRGGEGFDVVNKEGQHLALKESMPFRFDPITFDSDLEMASRQKSAYQFHLVDKDGVPQGTAYYPTGKQAFIILRFQVYNAYPNVKINPDKVAGVHEHFRALDALYLDRMLNSLPSTQGVAASTTVPPVPPVLPPVLPPTIPANTPSADTQSGVLRPLFNLESKKLFTDLRTLTDAGDISLSDAKSLLDEFAYRSAYLASNNQPDFLHTLALSLYLNEDDANATYPRLPVGSPVPAVPAVPVPPVIANAH